MPDEVNAMPIEERNGNLILRAPWTPAQVEILNGWQSNGEMHPYTCGNDSSHLLVATVNGWTCTRCYYTQDWAHVVTGEV